SVQRGSQIREVVDWGAGERRRRRLEAELERIVAALPQLGVRRAILFGSLARGDVGGQSDLDLILIVDTQERFLDRCRRFYAPLDHFYLSTRYPNSLPGGIPADAFAGSDAGRALWRSSRL